MRINSRNLFMIISGACLVVTFLSLLFTRGEDWSRILDANGYFYMSDFLMHLQFVDNPENVYFAYEGCCFPPLAYVFFLFVNRILPTNGAPDMNYYRSIPAAVLLIFVGIMLCMMLLAMMIREYSGGGVACNIALVFLILFSEPFLCDAIERGNTVLYTLVFVMLALYFKDSPSKIAREMALLLLVVAACFKIYPAIFGLLYIKEKRWKEVGRLILYGILLFFLPFVFFGGFGGFLQFLHNLTVVQDKVTLNLCTITGCVEFLYAKLFMDTSVEITADMIPAYVHSLGVAVSFLYLIVVCVLVMKENKRWKTMLYLGSLMIIFTNSSYSYTTIYMLIPFLYFLKDEGDEMGAESIVNALLFGLIFTIFNLPWPRFEGFFGFTIARLIRYPAIYMMILFNMGISMVNYVSAGRNVNTQK